MAAAWWGAACGVADALAGRAHARPLDAYASAHLGAVAAALAGARWSLAGAAGEIDADPGDTSGGAMRRALGVRAVVEDAASTVLAEVGRALGAGPLCTDAGHAARVADLTVYLRQSHAQRDLAALADRVISSLDRGTGAADRRVVW